MSVEKVKRSGGDVWRVRWRDPAGHNRSKVIGSHRDALAFDADVRRRRRTGELAQLDAGLDTLDEYVTGTWASAHLAHLAPKTRANYATLYDRHIAPWFAAVRLRDIDAEAIASWRGELVRARTGPEAIHKAMTLLGAILQRAAEAGRIPYNPARLVRKPKRPPRQEVRPLAPVSVEALRATLSPRDRALVSVLAYAGLRPHEARGLTWHDVRAQTLLAYGKGRRRTVRLLAPLAADLSEWRLACGRPHDDALVFPSEDGGPWTANGFEKWRQRVWAPALRELTMAPARPYDLRHSFASLLLHEGRSVIYVARQLGHGAELTMGTYGHVIDELEDAPRMAAEDAIRAARETTRERSGTRFVPRAG